MYEDNVDFSKIEEFLPKPSGYRILIATPEVKNITQGGIIKPDELIALEKVASITGLVVALGSDAYKDGNKFPNGPWCKQGDWVLLSSYSGTRMKVQGQEFRLINDDAVLGVVTDPTAIARV